MNTREKIMAGAVGGLLMIFVLLYGWRSVGRWYQVRIDQRDKLAAQVNEEELLLLRGNRTANEYEALLERSLPGDVDVARSLYQQKLLDLATEMNLSEIDVATLSVSPSGRGYQELTFKLKGRGDLRQATQLLYQFYRSNSLQRVNSLSLKPVRESKLLDIDLTVQALVVDGADRTNKLIDSIDPRFASVEVDTYLDAIVGRNLFSRANEPPKLAGTRQSAYVGETVRVEVKASDADKLDQLTYALDPSAPKGASIDPKTGSFRFSGGAKGDHVFKVIVTDDGLPAKSSQAEIKVAITDRPPPPKTTPKPPERVKPDDNVLNTFVTAITGVGETSRVWFSVRTTGETLKIPLGEKFKVGNYTAVVNHIGENSIEVHAEGRHLLMALGDSFADAIEIPPEGL